MEINNKERIERILMNKSNGLIISEIIKETKLTRGTVLIALAELKGENKIEIRNVGPSKLCYWKEKSKIGGRSL